jgi:hypothetical protein
LTAIPERLWRVFPWDPEASEGDPFSATYMPAMQVRGRFDLPGVPGGVLYLAESPEHAVAEMIQHYRGQVLDSADLRAGGHALALLGLRIAQPFRGDVVDLCDPRVLVRLGIRPDQTASRDRATTQRIAAMIHAAGHAGLRWWSALAGDWHTVVLFRDRLRTPLDADAPEPLTLEHPAVREAARALGIALEPSRRAGRR